MLSIIAAIAFAFAFIYGIIRYMMYASPSEIVYTVGEANSEAVEKWYFKFTKHDSRDVDVDALIRYLYNQNDHDALAILDVLYDDFLEYELNQHDTHGECYADEYPYIRVLRSNKARVTNVVRNIA